MIKTSSRIAPCLAAWAMLLLIPAAGLGLSLLLNRDAITSDLLQLLPAGRTDATETAAFDALHELFAQALIVRISNVEASADNRHRARAALLGIRPSFATDSIWIAEDPPLPATMMPGEGGDTDFGRWIWPLFFPQWLETRLTVGDLDPNDPQTYSILARQAVAELDSFLDDPLAMALADWLPHDPLLLLPSNLQRLAPDRQPSSPTPAAIADGITLWIPVNADPFSPQGQAAMLEWERQCAAALEQPFPDATITTQGLHRPAMESEARIRREVLLLNSCSALLVLILLVMALRHPRRVVALFIPVLSAILWGAWVTILVFGSLHILAIGIASVLFGVAVDYGLHVATHAAAQDETDLKHSFHAIRKPLLIGATSTAFGFAFLLLAPIDAIRQVGVMIPVGVCAALLACQFLLPRTAGPAAPLPPLFRRLLETPLPARVLAPSRLVLPILAIISLIILIQPTFNDSPDALQPPAGEQRMAYTNLRNATTQGSPSTILWLTYASSVEQFAARLDAVRQLGATPPAAELIGGGNKARHLTEVFIANRHLFASRLSEELDANGFEPTAFSPALTALADADQLLSTEQLDDAIPAMANSLHGPARAMLGLHNGTWFTVYPAPPDSPTSLPVGTVRASETERIAAALASARMDMIHWLLLALSTLTLIFCLTIGIRLTPLLILIPATAVALPLAAISLFSGITLLALLGGIMGFCLALDYAAFTITSRSQPVPSVRLSALTTGSVFAILALSSIPAISQMGITVAAAVTIGALAAEFTAGMSGVNPDGK